MYVKLLAKATKNSNLKSSNHVAQLQIVSSGCGSSVPSLYPNSITLVRQKFRPCLSTSECCPVLGLNDECCCLQLQEMFALSPSSEYCLNAC